jgi:anti-sigma regulatory factor (Ser/Thr protein kinase)
VGALAHPGSGSTVESAHELHPVVHESDVGALRRRVTEIAVGARVAERLVHEAELVATELGTNLARYAQRGAVLVRPLHRPRPGIELVAFDHGPGLASVDHAMAGPRAQPAPGEGLGVGLRSVRRLSSTFDIDSEPGRGTVVLARLESDGPPAPGPLESGAVCVPKYGTGPCGDRWAVRSEPTATWVLVVDGLGHGPGAEEAAVAVTGAFDAAPLVDFPTLFGRLHAAARGTRGGVAAVCRIDHVAGILHFAGAGNVVGRVLDRDGAVGLMSADGVLGTQEQGPTIRTVDRPWRPGATLLLWTDGVTQRGAVEAARRLGPHATVTAATLHRDAVRGTDDATVVVVHDRRDRQP